jgi:ankyrin repeat protein
MKLKDDIILLIDRAVKQNKITVLKFILENLNNEDEVLAKSLHYAAQHNNIEIAEFVLDKGVDVSVLDGFYTPFFRSILNNNFDFADFLLSHGAEVENLDDKEVSDFLAICYRGDGTEMQLQFLIDRGANIFQKDRLGRDGLFGAVTCNTPETMKFLVNNGLDINTADNDDITAVQLAINENLDKALDFFIEYYEFLNERNKKLINGYRLDRLFT